MKKLLLLLSLCLSPFAFASAESIKDFSIDYTIREDGVVLVEENILYDFGPENRHGIFRTLERGHPQESGVWYKERKVDIEVKEVSLNQNYVPYETTGSRNELEIKIGDPDSTITGEQLYRLRYELRGALSYGTAGAELYWNATGNGWPVPIEKVEVTVHGENTDLLKLQSACYAGPFGSDTPCTEIRNEGETVVFGEEGLQVNEGLTIATEINDTKVAFLSTEQVSYLPLGFILATIFIIYLAIKVYRFRREFKKDIPIIAQYEPYSGYLPMYSGVLIDGRLDPRDITAGILYLAEQGFIKIKKTEKKVLFIFNTTDYEIILLRPQNDIPTQFLKTLMGLLFETTDPIETKVLLSSLVTKKAANFVLIHSLEKNLKDDIRASGLTTNKLNQWSFTSYFTVALLVAFCLFFYTVEDGVGVIVYLLLPTVFLVATTKMDRNTSKGYEVKNHLEGFKLFLSVTDKERFDFHNAPEKSPELFMKYLPYAVAFGVEEKWAKVFSDITMPNPSWYEGSGGVANFSAVALTSDISAFSSSLSASSGTSGSSGGGSSGGGGGGGGGGSW